MYSEEHEPDDVFTMFHATPVKRLPSVLMGGVRMSFSRCTDLSVWVCTLEGLVPVIMHLAEKKGMQWFEFSVVKVRVHNRDLVRTGISTRFKLYRDIHRTDVRLYRQWDAFVIQARSFAVLAGAYDDPDLE